MFVLLPIHSLKVEGVYFSLSFCCNTLRILNRVCVKVWNLANCKLKTNHIGHTGYLNTVTVSPDGSLCASGGKVRPHHTGFLFQRRAASRTGYDYFIEMYTYVILVYWLKIIKFMIIDFREKNPQVVVFVRCYSK